MNKHINFNAFIRCIKTRNKNEYTLSSNVYHNDSTLDKCLVERFKVITSDLKQGQAELIQQITKFIDNHELTKDEKMSNLIIKTRLYRGVKIVDSISTWNLIKRKVV